MSWARFLCEVPASVGAAAAATFKREDRTSRTSRTTASGARTLPPMI